MPRCVGESGNPKSKIGNPKCVCATRAVPESNTEEEEVMSKENDGAAPRPLPIAFPLTVAAMEKGKEIREAISKGETVDLEPVTVKGMFNGRASFFDEEAMK